MSAVPITRDLVAWEGGTDLVLAVAAETTAAAIWKALTDPARCAEFFAAYDLAEDSDGDLIANFRTDDGEFSAVVVSAETPAGASDDPADSLAPDDLDTGHLVLDVDGLGRIALALAEDAGTTTITLAHTLADAGEELTGDDLETAADEAAAVWAHHLGLLLDHLAAHAEGSVR